jgi:hypothetical protein
MSSAFPSDRSEHGTERSIDFESLRAAAGYPLRAAGFWSAIALPFVILGLLAVGAAQQSPVLLSGLLTANVVGLVLGRTHNR